MSASGSPEVCFRKSHLQATESRVADVEQPAVQAKREVAAAEKRRAPAQADIARRQMLIDRADALQAPGFDAAALARLAEVLGACAQAQGKPVAEVVDAFLAAAADGRTLGELGGRIAGTEKAAEDGER